jgi:N-acetylneuraminate synthase
MGKFILGEKYPVFIIAEIGVNHNGDLKVAYDLIDKAIDAGANAVKFQKRKLEKIYPKTILENPNSSDKSLRYLIPYLQKVELSDDSFKKIKTYCKSSNIMFLCTPFDTDSADFLEELEVPGFKVASADLTNIPLVDHLIRKRKPLLLSTGMSKKEEIDMTVNLLRSRSATFGLLHCNSTYPAPFEHINLRFISVLKQYNVPIGYSGHERGIAVSGAAVALGASIIERHITCDRLMEGPDHKASLEPDEFFQMVKNIRDIEKSLGSAEHKTISVGETSNRDVLAKSLIAKRNIKLGEKITKAKIDIIGPGFGLSPQRMVELIGKKATRNMSMGESFCESDINPQRKKRDRLDITFRWGYIVRFRDYQSYVSDKPHCFEFHFTDKDIGETFDTHKTYKQQLIIHAPEFYGGKLVDLCTDGKNLSESLTIVQESIHKARSMGVCFSGIPMVVVHPGAMSLHGQKHGGNYKKLLGNAIEKLDTKGIRLLLENLPPKPWYFGGQWNTHYFMDSKEIRDFCRTYNISICYDISHAKLYCNWSGKSMLKHLEELLPYIKHVHISDADGIDYEGLQIGEGSINFNEIFFLLKNYKGTLVPEIWRGHLHNGQGFRTALEKIQVYFKKDKEELL